MPATLNKSELEILWQEARERAGNWLKFNDFAAFNLEPDEYVHYLSSRDEGLLDESNRLYIENALELVADRTNGDFTKSKSNHWAVGYLYAVTTRPVLVTDSDHPAEFLNPVFIALMRLVQRMDDYPVLDEEDYSEREYNQTIENIKTEFVGSISSDAPDDWAHQVHDWLYENNQSAVDNTDDQGGWPSTDDIKEAIAGIAPDKEWIDD